MGITGWKFSCKWRDEIPLPPEYSFPQAFNYLNPDSNSFYILEHPNGNYIQCGGSKKCCTVEMRVYGENNTYTHYRIGHQEGSTTDAAIKMTDGVVTVEAREVLTHWEAIELFDAFFSGSDIPSNYKAREIDI